MRYGIGAGFGLVALLIAVAIMFYLFTENTAQIQTVSQPAKAYAQRLTGKDESGMPAKDSITLQPYPADGRLRGVQVVSVLPGGPMDVAYGLQKDDIIVEAEMDLRDTDFGLAKDMVLSAYTKSKPMTVLRKGEKIELPLPKPPAATGASGSPGGTTAQPAPPADTRSELQKQLDKLTAPK